MGLGDIGFNADVIIKRKFRWTFEMSYCNNTKKISKKFCKTAKRPGWDIEETEINYLHGKTWIPGKATFQEYSLVYYDTNMDDTANLLSWLATVYNFTNPKTLQMNSKLGSYTGVGTLTLYDGCGFTMESWQLEHMWPKTVDFGELDYATSDECTVDLTLRYTNLSYQGGECGAYKIAPCECVC